VRDTSSHFPSRVIMDFNPDSFNPDRPVRKRKAVVRYQIETEDPSSKKLQKHSCRTKSTRVRNATVWFEPVDDRLGNKSEKQSEEFVMWDVDEIRGYKTLGCVLHYKVHWLNFSSKHDLWIPVENLVEDMGEKLVTELIEEFNAKAFYESDIEIDNVEEDGVSLLSVKKDGTGPLSADTESDEDGVSLLSVKKDGTGPLSADTESDEEDGVSLLSVMKDGTDPLSADTESDEEDGSDGEVCAAMDAANILCSMNGTA
jgi:hypothetical protein